MDTRHILVRAAALKALADEAQAVSKAVRAETDDALADLYDQTGSKSFDAKLDDGTKVASISLAFAKGGVQITDEAAFLAWVKSDHPEALVESVHPDFRAQVLKRAVADDAGVYDPDTGEVIPGAEPKPAGERPKSYSVRLTDKPALVAAWQRGEILVLDDYRAPALEGGSDE